MKPFNILFTVLGITAAAQVATAQEVEIPLQQPEEKRAADQQEKELNAAMQTSVAEAGRSTVSIWLGGDRLAFGTVVGDGTQIVTKWSQLATGATSFIIQAAGGETRSAKITGVYEDEDLALLSLAGRPFTPIKWVERDLPLGSFIAMPKPDGRVAAFGVVSVLARNLRDTDQAFFGISADPRHTQPGVRIRSVEEESGAMKAGIRKGDIIRTIDDREVTGLLELRNALTGTKPGDTVRVEITRNQKELAKDIILGNRPELPKFDNRRLQYMQERMSGGELSKVRGDFSSAVQTDMRAKFNQIGGPILSLRGEAVGLSLARSGRTKCYYMPSSAVKQLLSSDPINPAVAMKNMEPQLAKVERKPNVRRMLPFPQPKKQRRPSGARLKQHFEEMERLMRFMEQELELLEEGR